MSWISQFSLLLVLIFCTLQNFYTKGDNESKGFIDDVIVDFVNFTYIDEDTFELSVGYNDGAATGTKVRVDLIRELPKVVYAKIKVWGRAFGQYKLPTGISMDLNICDRAIRAFILDSAFKQMGINSTDCPPKPGRFEIENYNEDMTALPFYNLQGLQLLLEYESYSPPPDTPTLKLEDIIVDFVNGSYLDEETLIIEVAYHLHTSNGLSVHIDIIKELPPTVYFRMSVLGRAFGQYKVPTGININMNLCDEKFKRFFLDKIWESIGVDTTYCPPKPGSYEKIDFPTDMPALPLYALPGFHVQIESEVYGEPDILLLKVRSYIHIL